MLAAAEAAGVIHLLNFEFRHDAARKRMKRLIDEGAVGTPRHVCWTMYSSGSRTPLRRHGWLFDAALGGGWVGLRFARHRRA
jgi:predicted dehydrogenase